MLLGEAQAPNVIHVPRPVATLAVKRLGGLCDAFELDRAGVTRKDDLIEVLARSKRASFEEILRQLKRDELKDICRAHDLDARRCRPELVGVLEAVGESWMADERFSLLEDEGGEGGVFVIRTAWW